MQWTAAEARPLSQLGLEKTTFSEVSVSSRRTVLEAGRFRRDTGCWFRQSWHPVQTSCQATHPLLQAFLRVTALRRTVGLETSTKDQPKRWTVITELTPRDQCADADALCYRVLRPQTLITESEEHRCTDTKSHTQKRPIRGRNLCCLQRWHCISVDGAVTGWRRW